MVSSVEQWQKYPAEYCIRVSKAEIVATSQLANYLAIGGLLAHEARGLLGHALGCRLELLSAPHMGVLRIPWESLVYRIPMNLNDFL